MDQINHVTFTARALPVIAPDADLSNAETDRALASLDLGSEKTRATLALLKTRGIVIDPTLSLYELFTHDAAAMASVEPGLRKVAPQLKEALETMGPSPSSDRADAAGLRWKANLGTVRALHQAGVPIVAGPIRPVPGHSLHREMESCRAGFTPRVQAATIVPARAMKRDKTGTEGGQDRDFPVVDGDPRRHPHPQGRRRHWARETLDRERTKEAPAPAAADRYGIHCNSTCGGTGR
jgi:imidazolonepropionase-like amidohydrolase